MLQLGHVAHRGAAGGQEREIGLIEDVLDEYFRGLWLEELAWVEVDVVLDTVHVTELCQAGLLRDSEVVAVVFDDMVEDICTLESF